MKKRHIIGIILCAIIIAGGIIAGIYSDDIKAIYKGIKYDSEKIEEEITKNEKKNEELLKEYKQENIKPLGEEDAKKLKNGEITEEDAIKIILGKTDEKETSAEEKDQAKSDDNDEGKEPEKQIDKQPEKQPEKQPDKQPEKQSEKQPEKQPDKQTEKQSEKQPEKQPEKQSENVEASENTEEVSVETETKTFDDKLGELIAKIYVLKANYNSKIHDENYAAASKFYSLPKEQQTKDKKYEIGLTFMRNVLNLQDQCDAEMEAVLSEISNLLTENGMTTELVQELRNAYNEEKELKKAYFINKYSE